MAMTTNSSNTRRASMSEINVTPLVDVMLVLLIIFMVTAPMMQQGIDVSLPETSNTGVTAKEDPFVLVIRPDGKVFADTTEIPMPILKKKLKAIFTTRNNKQIYIQADKRVDYGTVAYAMGEIKAAGIHNIALITLPKNK